LASRDPDESILVHVAQVTGVEPAVDERLGVLLGQIPVALSDTVASEEDQTGLVAIGIVSSDGTAGKQSPRGLGGIDFIAHRNDESLHAVDGWSDRPFSVDVDGVGRDTATRLGQTISLTEKEELLRDTDQLEERE